MKAGAEQEQEEEEEEGKGRENYLYFDSFVGTGISEDEDWIWRHGCKT